MMARIQSASRTLRTLRHVLLLALAGAAGGCGHGDPLDGTVNAKDELGLKMWQLEVGRDLTATQAADLGRALQEYRFHVMAAGTVHGSAAIEDAVLQMINGQTLRHVLQEGIGWELERAEAERSTLAAGMATNAQMRTRPGDTDSADYLTDLRTRQVARLKAATDEVNLARESLLATGATAPAAPSPAPDR